MMTVIIRHLIGVRHDGLGRFALQIHWTSDPAALAEAQAADPGHTHGVYEYQPKGWSNRCATEEQARRLAARYRPGQEG